MNTRAGAIGLSRDRMKYAIFGFCGLGFLALAVPAFFEPMTFWTGIVFGEYAYPMHELHHFVLGAVAAVLLLGVCAQAFRPKNRVGALHTSIIIWVILSIVFAIGGEFSPIHLLLLGLLLGMGLVHPGGVIEPLARDTVDRRMAGIAVLTSVGAVASGAMELWAHLSTNDPHVGFGHYMFMAVAWLSIGALTLYASARGIDWRFPTYTAAFFLVVIGVASIVYPGSEQGSSLGIFLGGVAILWALFVIVVAERGDDIAALLGR